MSTPLSTPAARFLARRGITFDTPLTGSDALRLLSDFTREFTTDQANLLRAEISRLSVPLLDVSLQPSPSRLLRPPRTRPRAKVFKRSLAGKSPG